MTNTVPTNKGVLLKQFASDDQIIRTLLYVQKSSHLCTDAYDQDDQVIDLMFLQETRHRQYQVRPEVHVYKHAFLNLWDFQNDEFVLCLLYNQDIDYQPGRKVLLYFTYKSNHSPYVK